MVALCQMNTYSGIEKHPSFLGRVSGLDAEKLLRGKSQSYLYLLRQGECVGAYYVTFVHPDGFIKHTPFEITHFPNGNWFCENGFGGEYKDQTIGEIIHRIMYCEEGECTPYTSALQS